MMPVTGDSSALVQALDPVHLGAAIDAGQHCVLFDICRHDKLAAIRVRHALLGAIGVERLATRDAEPRHQAAGRIINAGVDHLAVARGCLGADPFRGIQDDHFAAG